MLRSFYSTAGLVGKAPNVAVFIENLYYDMVPYLDTVFQKVTWLGGKMEGFNKFEKDPDAKAGRDNREYYKFGYEGYE